MQIVFGPFTLDFEWFALASDLAVSFADDWRRKGGGSV